MPPLFFVYLHARCSTQCSCYCRKDGDGDVQHLFPESFVCHVRLVFKLMFSFFLGTDYTDYTEPVLCLTKPSASLDDADL